MRIYSLITTLLVTTFTCLPLLAKAPAVLGKGVGLFEVGPLIASDDFKTLDHWVIQIQQNDKKPEPKVVAKNGTLDCFLPGRGCTAWFKELLKTRVTISYDVLCPSPSTKNKDLLPRDLNNFWMANDPEGDLFDSGKYTGDFSTYHQMEGYYASTGGGRNTTTRMRRYPREVAGKPAAHLALNSRDGVADSLIKPDHLMRVQLVAFDDVIQYIVDGKLVYEISHGDDAQIETRDADDQRVMRPLKYDAKLFPIYREGYFGFRMVGTHHIYSNFRVHALQAIRKKVTVSSIEQLRATMAKSDQLVTMKPGTYDIPDLINGQIGVEMSGSHNELDLTGVTLRTPISLLSNPGKSNRGTPHHNKIRGYLVSGDHVTLRGGTFDTPHPEHTGAPINFGSYNQNPANHPAHATTDILLEGDHIQLIDCHLTVRGSSPYGYGNIYGIGGGAVIALRKHSGILMTGDHIIIDGCSVKMEAFGHAIFVQGGDQITVKNCEVEGQVRPSNDLYKEDHPKDLAKKFNYQMQWPESIRGIPIPKDHMINLVEDGIRAYKGTGHMTVENCKVTKTRGGIKLYLARSATISNCEVLDCVVQGYSLPNKGTLRGSRGNAAYGPLLYIHSDSNHSQKIDLEIIPAPHALGDHVLAAIKGRSHTIRFTAAQPALTKRAIVVGYPMRFDFLSTAYPGVPTGYEEHFAKFSPETYYASKIRLYNRTFHPIVTGELSKTNQISSLGPINDLGTKNTTRRLAPRPARR